MPCSSSKILQSNEMSTNGVSLFCFDLAWLLFCDSSDMINNITTGRTIDAHLHAATGQSLLLSCCCECKPYHLFVVFKQ